ncbi:MAG: class I SAM-dependent methyltransferase [Candidatus Theseobacter exili]|nr:class I SAM-dependent methyltransferase [Candidatus Theseobacter exili]
MKSTVNNPCFVCGSASSQLLFGREYSAHYYPGTFAIRKCDKCGLLFNSPRLSDEELFNLYDTNYYFFQRHDVDEFQRITDVFLRTMSFIQNGVIEKSVAEIGSAKGYLLALLKHLGWSVQGIEISSDASEYAISKFGVPTFTGTIKDYSKSNHKDMFSVVLAIDVIEHVPNPIDFLHSVDKILRNTGLLIIDTPNGSAHNIKLLGSNWKGFNPFHIYFFSSHILQALLINMGYSIENSFSYGNRPKYHLTYAEECKKVFNSLLPRLGVLEQSKLVYRGVTNVTKYRKKDVESLIRNASEIIRKNSTYLDTDDARDELAKEIRGDNIVIIARKTA